MCRALKTILIPFVEHLTGFPKPRFPIEIFKQFNAVLSAYSL